MTTAEAGFEERDGGEFLFGGRRLDPDRTLGSTDRVSPLFAPGADIDLTSVF